MALSSVEDELRKIEEDFHSGRMNAFGNQLTHERMEKELKKIKELDAVIFSRVSIFLERDDAAEWKLRRDVEPIPVPDPQPGGAGHSSTAGGGSAPAPTTSSTSSPTNATGTFGMRGVSDEAFASAGRYFSDMEREFGELGDSLRKMSGHVIALNQLAEVSNTGR